MLGVCTLEFETFAVMRNAVIGLNSIALDRIDWMVARLEVGMGAEEGGEAANTADESQSEEAKLRARRGCCHISFKDE